jgi:hypothetical protein
VTSGVPPKHFVRGEWFIGTALLTGLVWVVLYWLIVREGGASIWWPTLIAFAVGYTLRVLALYRGWEEPLAPEPAGVSKHDDGRPLLGRKLAGYLVGGETAKEKLDELKGSLAVHNAAVMAVLFLVFGVDLIAKGIPPVTMEATRSPR